MKNSTDGFTNRLDTTIKKEEEDRSEGNKQSEALKRQKGGKC